MLHEKRERAGRQAPEGRADTSDHHVTDRHQEGEQGRLAPTLVGERTGQAAADGPEQGQAGNGR